MSDAAPKSRDFDDLAREEGPKAVKAAVEAARSIPSNDNVRKPIPVELFSDIQPSLNGIWTVKDLIPAGGMAGIYGSPGTGKSFLALDIALHVALGRPWFGRETKQGGVVYVCAEGAEGARRRIGAFRANYAISEEVPFALVPAQLDLLQGDDIDRLINALGEQGTRLPHPLELAIVDTLSRTFGGGDENTSAMATYVANLGRLQQALGCGLIIVHHSPKDQTNDTPRGHGSLLGALDTCIKVEGASGLRTVRVTKQKDGDPAPEFKFALQSIDIGSNSDGEVISSCVVIEPARLGGALGALVNNGGAKPKRLSDSQKVALGALRFLAMSNAITHRPPAHVLARCGAATALPLAIWQEEAICRMMKADNKPDSARRAFDRACASLQASGYVEIFDGWAWLIVS
jgi:hypothetical protein